MVAHQDTSSEVEPGLVADFGTYPSYEMYRAKWLARLAIIGPFLTLLIVFWLAGRSE